MIVQKILYDVLKITFYILYYKVISILGFGIIAFWLIIVVSFTYYYNIKTRCASLSITNVISLQQAITQCDFHPERLSHFPSRRTKDTAVLKRRYDSIILLPRPWGLTVRFPIPQGWKRLKGVYLEIRVVLLARVSNNVFIVVVFRKENKRTKPKISSVNFKNYFWVIYVVKPVTTISTLSSSATLSLPYISSLSTRRRP